MSSKSLKNHSTNILLKLDENEDFSDKIETISVVRIIPKAVSMSSTELTRVLNFPLWRKKLKSERIPKSFIINQNICITDNFTLASTSVSDSFDSDLLVNI